MPHDRYRFVFKGCAIAAILSVATPALGYRIEGFQTPTGSVHCIYVADERSLRCDVLEPGNGQPPAPDACDLDWGAMFSLGDRGLPTRICAGDTSIDARHPVLGHDRKWRQDGLACTVHKQGLRCTNRDGHGWLLDRKAQRLY